MSEASALCLWLCLLRFSEMCSFSKLYTSFTLGPYFWKYYFKIQFTGKWITINEESIRKDHIYSLQYHPHHIPQFVLSPSSTSSWSEWINLDEAIKRSRCCLLQIYYKPPIILSGAPKNCSVIDWSFKTLLKGRIPTIVLSGAASMSNKLLCSWLKAFRLFSCRWFLQYLLTATQFQNITTSFQTIPVKTLIR